MKKLLCILLSLCCLTACFGCGGGGGKDSSGDVVDDDKTIVSRIATAPNGYSYLEVDGKPFAYFGVESRLDAYMNCEKKTVEDFEAHVKAAADLGATVVAVPIDWRDLEIAKDDYDFRIIAALLEYANKYDIKIEFCWYSINMCGDSNSYQIPEYIWNDEKTYPKYESSNKGVFWGYYGYQGYMQPSKALMERETLMIEKLMDYVYNWDLVNGEKHPLIGVQVYNEPDGYPRWRVDQQYIKKDGQRISVEDAWADVYTLLDNAGKAFKRSKYNVYTRTNLTVLREATDFVEKIYDLEGIDSVGNDPYMESTGGIRDYITSFRETIPGNFNHIAENKGVYTNTPSLMITTAIEGAGYMIYDLSTPQYFKDNTGDPSTIDHGVLNVDLTDKDHTPAVRATLKALAGAGDAAILANKGNFVAFNIESSHPDKAIKQIVNLKHLKAQFETQTGAVGFAIEYDGYCYLFATDEASVTLSGATFGDAEYGAYKNGVWTTDSQIIAENGVYNISNGKLCRIKLG